MTTRAEKIAVMEQYYPLIIAAPDLTTMAALATECNALTDGPDDPEPDDEELPADSAAVLRDAVEQAENEDERDGEGRDQHG